MLKTLVAKKAAGLGALLFLEIIQSLSCTPGHRNSSPLESLRGPGFALESVLSVPPSGMAVVGGSAQPHHLLLSLRLQFLFSLFLF